MESSPDCPEEGQSITKGHEGPSVRWSKVTLGAAQPRGQSPKREGNPKVETAMKAHRPSPTPLGKQSLMPAQPVILSPFPKPPARTLTISSVRARYAGPATPVRARYASASGWYALFPLPGLPDPLTPFRAFLPPALDPSLSRIGSGSGPRHRGSAGSGMGW